MKRIKIVYNSRKTPVKFPAQIKYFRADDLAHIGEKRAQNLANQWAVKNNLVILAVEVTLVEDEVTVTLDDILNEVFIR